MADVEVESHLLDHLTALSLRCYRRDIRVSKDQSLIKKNERTAGCGGWQDNRSESGAICRAHIESLLYIHVR